MNRLIERYKAKGLGPKEILTNVINHIYGFDINPFACHITEMNLLFQVIDLFQEAKDKDEAFQLPRFNVYQTDSLEAPSSTLYKWQYTNSKIQKYVEEKEIVDKIKSKEFDFVLGNPPYVSLSMTIRRLFKENKPELAEHYKALIGVYRKLFKTPFKNFDLYMLFLEKGLNWLSENGKLGFICSDQFMMTFYGRKLRSYLLENSNIRHIVDFGDSGVFQDVTNYPCILVLEKRDRTKTNQIQCVKVYKPTDNILSAVESVASKGPYKSDYFSVFAIQQKKLSAQVWTLAPSNEVDIIDKMREKASQTLGELCDFDSGIRTGKDPLFVVRLIKETEGPNCTVLPYGYRKEKKTFTVEKEMLRPVLRGRNVRRWRTTWDNLFVLFPHKEVGDRSVSISEDELKEKYPNTYKYLEAHKAQLKSRSHYGKTPEELHGTWYALMHPAKYLKVKILSPQLTNQTNFAMDEEGYRFLGGPGGLMGIVPKNSSSSLLLLGLLNSKLYDFYLKHSTQIKAGKYYQFGISHLTNFPISTFNNEKELTREISGLTGQIIESYQNLAKCKVIKSDFARLLDGIETVKLDDFPSLVFNLKMKKLGDIRRHENTVYLNLVDTISCKDGIVARYVELLLNGSKDELEKAEDLVSEIYHLQIPKNITDIEKVVNSYLSTLKEGGRMSQEIAKLEKEIDQKVYRLFGLSHSEIALVERP
jgi:hypothetical protein